MSTRRRRNFRQLRPLLESVSPAGTTPLLSVLMPVYQEAGTAAEVIDAILALQLDHFDLELVIVESNSSDGSRQVVERYRDDPRVTLVLQDVARGKGNAVREAMRHARGDVFLIQDADLEYVVDDYAVLLAPILYGAADFVLGNRHIPGHPIRWIGGAPWLSRLMNTAHWMFATLFNLTYGTRLRDPFTMYKVVRREALEGLNLVGDRFDFDWELVGKLVRSGYEPLEVPVRYQARGYDEGKKIRPIADPPSWVRACFRFRFDALRVSDPTRAVVRPRTASTS